MVTRGPLTEKWHNVHVLKSYCWLVFQRQFEDTAMYLLVPSRFRILKLAALSRSRHYLLHFCQFRVKIKACPGGCEHQVMQDLICIHRCDGVLQQLAKCWTHSMRTHAFSALGITPIADLTPAR